MNKRILRFLTVLAVTIICCLGCQNSISAANAKETSTEQFLYQYNSTYNGIELTKYLGKDAVVNIPAKIGETPVKAIGTECFYKKKYLTEVTMPDTVVSIGDQAFGLCRSLEKVTLSKSLEHMGKEAFAMCKIRSVSMPDSLTELGKDTFWGCRFLESVVCSENLAELNGTFSRCENLKTVKFLPLSKITKIGEDTFYRCSSLKEIEIPVSVTEIAEEAFSHSGLENITFAEDSALKMIGAEAFAYSNLKNIRLPENVTELGRAAFLDCHKLEKAVCSKELAELDHTFSGCLNLKIITLPKDSKIKKIGENCFYDCKNLKEILIPESVTEIGSQAFYTYGVKGGLEKITFAPDSALKEIGSGAFAYSNLKKIQLPASLEKIEDNIFDNCSKLKKITFAKQAKIKKLPDNCFGWCYRIEEVEIPENVSFIGSQLFGNIRYGKWRGTKNSIKKIQIKGKKIKKIGKEAFRGLRLNATITVPKKYQNKYTKMFQNQKWYKKTIQIKGVKKI